MSEAAARMFGAQQQVTGTATSANAERGQLLQHMQGPLFVAVAYYLRAEAAFLIGTLSDKIFAPFWPPNAILSCALILVPYRRWPLYMFAAFPAHLIAELGIGMGWPQLLVAFVTNCSVAALNAFALRYLLGPLPWFNSLHVAIVYVLIAAVCGPALAAFGGAFVRIAGGGGFENYPLFWGQWYVANSLGSLTLGALLLSLLRSKEGWSHFLWRLRSQRTEVLLLVTGMVLACTVAFNANTLVSPNYFPAFLYLPLPFVIWAAVRFRTTGASAAIFVVTVVCISSMLRGTTVFASGDVEANVLALQLFLMVVSVSILLLGAAVHEVRRAERTTARIARAVLGAQDAERRAIAKRLLDDICQRLAASIWVSDPERTPALIEKEVQRSIGELRELSYLLHPPMLEDGGLELALRTRLRRYTERTGIAVALDVSELGRLPAEMELTIFRVIEEALANVERHSGSTTARVSVRRGSPLNGGGVVMVAIEDTGRGMPWKADLDGLIDRMVAENASCGMGLARMRERLRRIGGELEISSGKHRTMVGATIPIVDPGPHAQNIQHHGAA